MGKDSFIFLGIYILKRITFIYFWFSSIRLIAKKGSMDMEIIGRLFGNFNRLCC